MVPGGKKYLAFTDALMDYVDASRSGADDPLLSQLRAATAQFGEDAQHASRGSRR
jgi:hypothetical protein